VARQECWQRARPGGQSQTPELALDCRAVPDEVERSGETEIRIADFLGADGIATSVMWQGWVNRMSLAHHMSG